MSGSSLDYVCYKLEEATGTIRMSELPIYQAFADHLDKVAKALHDVEWVISGDNGEGTEYKAIRSVITKSDELESAIKKADAALKDLRETIRYTKKDFRDTLKNA